ncbi:MAG: FHA domain-containing protein [Chitinispirillaceae bacterium]|nr:FHA domain-containing protein [Chitinispirillaceae bacterium]
MAKFMVFYEGKPLNTYIIDEPVITIGRLPENTISIANMGVSRRHLRIEEDYDRKFVLTDLNSLNGTSVNGKRVKKVPLHSGDKITIGKFTIVYEEIAPGVEVPSDYGSSGSVTAPQPAQESAPVEKKSDTKSYKKAREARSEPVDEVLPPRHQTQKMPLPGDGEGGEKTPILIDTAKHLSFIIDKPYMTIGSGDSDDIPVAGFFISEQQAYIELTDEGYRISSHKMMAKIRVNGRSIKSQILRHKDRIDIGSTSFRYMENG